MKPILYNAYYDPYNDVPNNGIGVLADAISCRCEEVLNGSYELMVELPYDSDYISDVLVNRILVVKPNIEDDPQPFRIYSIEKNTNGVVTIKAQHDTYQADGIPITPFSAENLEDAIANLNSERKLPNESPIMLFTNFKADGQMDVTAPTPLKNLLGGNDNSLLSLYGGDLYYDNYDIYLLDFRGTNRGMCFRYRNNIAAFNQSISAERLYSGVMGFFKKGNNFIYGNVVSPESPTPYDRVYILDVTNVIKKSTPSAEDIDDYVSDWLLQNDIGVPTINMTLDYIDDDITQICLGDICGVSLPEYNIVATARCTKVVYDCLMERNESIEIGDYDAGIAGEIASLSEDVENIRNYSS